jgi:membrane fusion protein, multidrug efflux system
LRTAELDLSYTRIAAPIRGQIGRALFTQGNLVGPEAGPLARLVQLDPVRIVFSISEGFLVTLRQQEATGSAIDPNALHLTLRLPNGADYPQTGQIEYVESEVNPQTGTVAMRAVFPNPDHILIPSQFVTLVSRETEIPTLPVVPQTAVLQDREGRFVYLLGENNTVSQRRIETGARVENGWAVTEGLSGGRTGHRAGHPAAERRHDCAAERRPAGRRRIVISGPFITRPRLAVVVSLVISIAGAAGHLHLPQFGRG